MTRRSECRKAILKTAAATAVLSIGFAVVSMTGAAGAAGKVGFSSPFLTDPFQAILANQSVDQIKAIGLEALAARIAVHW